MSRRHLIISGTGRAGTTALVQLFTYLGLDTGFDRDTCWEVDPIANAGLELDATREDSPYVIKSPELVEWLPQALERGITIDCAILPLRDLTLSTQSRVKVYEEHIRRGTFDALGSPGSLWKTSEPGQQAAESAQAFYRILETLARHEIPTYLPCYPLMTEDSDYLWRCLEPVWKDHRVNRSAFNQAHYQVMKVRGPSVSMSQLIMQGKHIRLKQEKTQ